MITEKVGVSNSETVAAGTFKSTASRKYQTGVYQIEIVGDTGTDPTITIQGKLVESTDAGEDSGWATLATEVTTVGDTVIVGTCPIMPHMSFTIASNDGGRNVQVTIGYAGE